VIEVRRWRLRILASACGALLAACGPKPIALPSDPGTPFSDFAAVHARLFAACSGVRTLTLELGLSGRAGEQRVRGRVIGGFERPSSMRLEGVAPFGPPAFILAARNGSGVLMLPRDSRILRNAAPEAILEALTGVALAPADLQAVLTGCVLPAPRPTAGRLHANGWASIDIETNATPGAAARTGTVFLRRAGSAWEVRAARRDQWQVEYPIWQGTFPQSVRLSSASPTLRVDLTAALSQIETNRDVDAAAFTVDERAGMMPMTIEELRAAGPLRGQ
jgi:outer membrane biogenesis lipoprotein LolB